VLLYDLHRLKKDLLLCIV